MYRVKHRITAIIAFAAIFAVMVTGTVECDGAVALSPHLNAYSNRELGLRFEYPQRYVLKELLAPDGGLINILIGISREGRTRWLLNIEPVDMSSYPRDMFGPSGVTAKDFAQEVAKFHCDADGPGSTVYCTGVARIDAVVTSRGLPGYEMFLNRVTELYGEDGAKSSQSDIRGPVYAFDISGGKALRILLVEPTDEAARMPSEAESLREIINALRVGTR